MMIDEHSDVHFNINKKLRVNGSCEVMRWLPNDIQVRIWGKSKTWWQVYDENFIMYEGNINYCC